MKKGICHLIFVLILLNGCKEAAPVEPSNYFQYEGKQYALEKGWIRNDDNPTGGIGHTVISLYSEGVTWDENLEEFIGKGHSLHIKFRRSTEKLIKGTYNYQSSTDGPYPLTISTTSFSVHWDWSNNTGLYGFVREGSVVEFSNEGDQYSLDFTLKPVLTLGNITSDSPVTGTFKGRLMILD